jgi:hypothetical protein
MDEIRDILSALAKSQKLLTASQAKTDVQLKKTDVQIAQLIGYNKNRDSSFETFVRDVISMKVVEGEFIIPGYQLRGYFKDFDCSVRSVALNETTGVYYYESAISKSRGKRLLQGFEWDSIHVFDSLVDDTLLLLLHEAKTVVEVADISETFQRLDKTVTFLQLLAAGNFSVQISFSPKLAAQQQGCQNMNTISFKSLQRRFPRDLLSADFQ